MSPEGVFSSRAADELMAELVGRHSEVLVEVVGDWVEWETLRRPWWAFWRPRLRSMVSVPFRSETVRASLVFDGVVRTSSSVQWPVADLFGRVPAHVTELRVEQVIVAAVEGWEMFRLPIMPWRTFNRFGSAGDTLLVPSLTFQIG